MYDAEGRLYEVVDQTICYTYDGDGDRVATTNCNVVNGGGGNTTVIIADFLYDPDHRLASHVNISTAKLTRADIYAGGEDRRVQLHQSEHGCIHRQRPR